MANPSPTPPIFFRRVVATGRIRQIFYRLLPVRFPGRYRSRKSEPIGAVVLDNKVTSPPGGVNLIALPIRLVKICVTLSQSAQARDPSSLAAGSEPNKFSCATGLRVSVTAQIKIAWRKVPSLN